MEGVKYGHKTVKFYLSNELSNRVVIVHGVQTWTSMFLYVIHQPTKMIEIILFTRQSESKNNSQKNNVSLRREKSIFFQSFLEVGE
jgi:hypothetical protein